MPTETATVEFTEYTVLVAAVTVATGRPNPQNRSQPEVVRVTRGQTISALPDNDSIVTLLSMKSIRPTSEFTGKEHVTARTMLKVFRDAGEVVDAPVVPEVAAIDAPLPVEDPNDL